jgi:hypothetical protein
VQYRLSTLALVTTLIAIYLGGVLNNPLSLFFVLLALATWMATHQVRGQYVIYGLVAVCGWLLAAAIIASAFRDQ